MNTLSRFSALSARLLLVSGLVAGSAFVIAPNLAFAASYGYVNTSGEVSVVTANDPITAMATAVNIAIHSGVILLVTQTDTIVGSMISGS